MQEFSKLTEVSEITERSIGNLYKDQSTLLQYAEAIMKDRNIRWDNEITGVIQKATDCIVHCIMASIKDAITKDIKKRIKVVMLSGRAFYFEELRLKLEEELKDLRESELWQAGKTVRSLRPENQQATPSASAVHHPTTKETFRKQALKSESIG